MVTVQTGISLAVNLGLNLALIPVLGAVGSALAIAAAEATGLVYLVMSYSRTPQHAKAYPVISGVLRVLVALAVAVAGAAGVAAWNWVAGLAVGVTVYFLFLFATRALGSQDIKILRPLFVGNPG